MEGLSMLKETSMRVSGWMIKHMAMEYTLTIMVANMKVSGLMINNMVSELKDGLMELSMKVLMNKE